MARKDKEDFTGRKIGYLTVLSAKLDHEDKKHSYWNCLCKCGNHCVKRSDALRTTPVPSCGCHKKEATSKQWSAELEGSTFGKLRVIRRVPRKERRALWECECDCGNTVYYPSRYLLAMGVNNCGCETKSYGELYVREQLRSNDIKFKEQYSFTDCLSPKGYRIKFDFAVISSTDNVKYLIEVNGPQHYQPFEFFGGEERFKYQQEIDNIKREYCRINNITLVEIPYTDIGKVNIIDLIESDL